MLRISSIVTSEHKTDEDMGGRENEVCVSLLFILHFSLLIFVYPYEFCSLLRDTWPLFFTLLLPHWYSEDPSSNPSFVILTLKPKTPHWSSLLEVVLHPVDSARVTRFGPFVTMENENFPSIFTDGCRGSM